MSGATFGGYTVIAPTGNRHNGSVVWRCRCSCGAEIVLSQKRIAFYCSSGTAPRCPSCAIMIDDYALGILWATSSVLDGHTIIRNADPHFADEFARQAGGKIFTLQHPRNGTLLYCLKVRREISDYALSLGWSGRSDRQRVFPSVNNPEAFTRAYIQCHSSIDLHRYTNRKGHAVVSVRFRVYGAEAIIAGINRVIHEFYECDLKTPQFSASTYTLYYQNVDEVFRICEAVTSTETRLSKLFSERFDTLWNQYQSCKRR